MTQGASATGAMEFKRQPSLRSSQLLKRSTGTETYRGYLTLYLDRFGFAGDRLPRCWGGTNERQMAQVACRRDGFGVYGPAEGGGPAACRNCEDAEAICRGIQRTRP